MLSRPTRSESHRNKSENILSHTLLIEVSNYRIIFPSNPSLISSTSVPLHDHVFNKQRRTRACKMLVYTGRCLLSLAFAPRLSPLHIEYCCE